MRPYRLATAALLLLPVLEAAPIRAQDVQYETVTKVDFPGAMGTMMRAAAKLGGGSMDLTQKTSIKGRRMRTDMEKTSMIMDLEGKRLVSLDHQAKTYTSMTFEQMAAQAQRVAAEMKNERTKAGQAGGDTELKFRFSVDAADQREKVSGYDAERYFLTMEMEGKYTPEGATEKEEGGTLVLLTDMWASKDVPTQQALSAFQAASAEEWASAGSAITKVIAAAFAGEPGVEVAFEQSVKEAKKVQGVPLRTVVHFVAVAPEQKFDRALATEGKPKSGGVLKAAGKGVLGGLAGRLGQKEEEQPAAEEAATQGTIFKVTTETRNISTKPVDVRIFEVPAGYREVKFEDLLK
jgi:hypothetical protein